jgi:hypothetical protein
MKLENRSSFHDNRIREIVNFVMPDLVAQVFEYTRYKVKKQKHTLTMIVKTGNGFTGQMDVDDHGRYFIYIQVAPTSRPFPYRESKSEDIHFKNPKLRYWIMDGGGTKDYIPTLMLSPEEALVHTIAHELRHVWQVMTESVWDKLPLEETQGKPHPGVGSDKDADKYAIRKQREWRKSHNQPVYHESLT